MPQEGDVNLNVTSRAANSLLASDEPQPFSVINATAEKPILLVCDHASRRFPGELGTMGLDPVARRCHLAWDIGAGALTRQVAKQLGVTAVMCGYSRLVVDCNRELMDPGAFLEFGDGVVIPGNRRLKNADKERRAMDIYWPYHNAITAQINRLQATGITPIFLSIHSFTPVMNGETRPWQMGILWDTDRLTSQILIHDFAAAGYHVGDNEPYTGKAPQDFTIDNHAEPLGLPHAGIEIRQDLIDDADGVLKIAELLGKTFETLPTRLQPTKLDVEPPPKSA